MSHELVVNVKTDGCDVYIGRGSDWGNPFKYGSRQQNIDDYENYILNEQPGLKNRVVAELRGQTLGCHCAPLPCHGDILARIANE
jgi:hypothetical protein